MFCSSSFLWELCRNGREEGTFCVAALAGGASRRKWGCGRGNEKTGVCCRGPEAPEMIVKSSRSVSPCLHSPSHPTPSKFCDM